MSAFIRNSGLDKLLGEDAPGFGAMFDNVGGRWTGDLHMMTFLAFHDLDADAYWRARYEGIKEARQETHLGNFLGNYVLDHEIKKIALVVPDELFWFGKAIEQNFNESIWQKGFANLRAVRISDWQAQAKNYQNEKSAVLDLTGSVSGDNVTGLKPVRTTEGKQVLAEEFGRLFTTFYGMTYTVGTRLIGRALAEAGLKAEDINVNDLENSATKIFQKNLFLRQPFVELGKGLLQKHFEQLQTRQREWERKGSHGISPIVEEANQVVDIARETDARRLAQLIKEFFKSAQVENKTFVPFIYLEGEKFTQLRQELVKLGLEWVLQGTGDQHISWQQVLANPESYLPFIISFVPEKQDMVAGVPAIGFAKGYLDNISPHMIRHFFANYSYEALKSQHTNFTPGLDGVFVSLIDSVDQREGLVEAFKRGVAEAATAAMLTVPFNDGMALYMKTFLKEEISKEAAIEKFLEALKMWIAEHKLEPLHDNTLQILRGSLKNSPPDEVVIDEDVLFGRTEFEMRTQRREPGARFVVMNKGARLWEFMPVTPEHMSGFVRAIEYLQAASRSQLERQRVAPPPTTAAMVHTAQLKAAPSGGIDLNSRNLKMQESGQKADIRFNQAMITQFKKGDFSGVRFQVNDVIRINPMVILGLKEDEETEKLVKA